MKQIEVQKHRTAQSGKGLLKMAMGCFSTRRQAAPVDQAGAEGLQSCPVQLDVVVGLVGQDGEGRNPLPIQRDPDLAGGVKRIPLQPFQTQPLPPQRRQQLFCRLILADAAEQDGIGS